MSATDDVEKKFVMKHVFKNVTEMKNDETQYGEIEEHFGVKWRFRMVRTSHGYQLHFECLHPQYKSDWSLTAVCTRKISKSDGTEKCGDFKRDFTNIGYNNYYFEYIGNEILKMFLVQNEIKVTFDIKITKVSGIEISKVKSFDDDVAKEFSDVVLKIEDQKYYVNKMYLSYHSTYFKALFSGNFSESEKSEIELKDINPQNMQKYLEFLYAEAYAEAHNVLGILHLADFFDSKTAIQKCEDFLVQKSELPLNEKFEIAIKYNLKNLKTMCMSEIKTAVDLQSIVPEEGAQFDNDVWNELFKKAMAFVPK